MTPFEYKDRMIIAQNQGPIALEITRLSYKGRIVTTEELLKTYIETHDKLMDNFKKKYLSGSGEK